jgi:hypothetical protein
MLTDALRATRACAVFELRRIVRSRSTWIGALLFLALLALGHTLYWRAFPPRPDHDRLFGYAYLLAMLASLHLGLATDRQSHFDHFLVGNLIRPAPFLLGKLTATVVYLLAFALFALALSFALSAGEWRYALWYSLNLTLLAWFFVPALLLTELAVDTRFPVPVVLIAFFVLTIATDRLIGVEALARLLGFTQRRLDFGSLWQLSGRALLVPVLLALLYPVCRWRLTRWPRSLRRS